MNLISKHDVSLFYQNKFKKDKRIYNEKNAFVSFTTDEINEFLTGSYNNLIRKVRNGSSNLLSQSEGKIAFEHFTKASIPLGKDEVIKWLNELNKTTTSKVSMEPVNNSTSSIELRNNDESVKQENNITLEIISRENNDKGRKKLIEGQLGFMF